MPNFEIARASPTHRSAAFEGEVSFKRLLRRFVRRRTSDTIRHHADAVARRSCVDDVDFEIVGNIEEEKRQKKEKRRVPALPPLFEAYHAAPPPPTLRTW